MLIVPDVERWIEEKETYTRTYLEWIKLSWIKELNSYHKRIITLKTDKAKQKYYNWVGIALDSLFKIDIVLNAL